MTHADWLREAVHISNRSKDPSTRTGAILVNYGQVIGRGYNQMPTDLQDTDERWNDRDLKLSIVIHAEMDALAQAARLGHGREVRHAALYNVAVNAVTGKPWGFHGACTRCAAHLIHAGISCIVSPYGSLVPKRWEADLALAETWLCEAGIELIQVDISG